MSKIKLFCDVDGVLFDFEAAFCYHYGLNPPQSAWDFYQSWGWSRSKFDQNLQALSDNFWYSMPEMDGFSDLLKLVQSYDHYFLTHNVNNKARKGKFSRLEAVGVNKNALLGVSSSELKASKYAKDYSCVLIDDSIKNCNEWSEAGGSAIYLHPNRGDYVCRELKGRTNFYEVNKNEEFWLTRLSNILNWVDPNFGSVSHEKIVLPTVSTFTAKVSQEVKAGQVVYVKDETAEKRKATPVFSGVLKYFPDALQAVAQCSRAGNEQHNPGSDLHWDRSKSGDELDALTRHLIDAGTLDTDGIRHSTKVAWRALANLQKEIENGN
jgi:hypothetical protein